MDGLALVDKLNNVSIKSMNFPLNDLPFSVAPPADELWMPEKMLSLYGTDLWSSLTDEQKIKLSQKEFSLLCSISCNGEKEAISDIAKLMLKKKFEHVRSYLSHLIREENNHIDMFVEFCQRYGELYRFRYIYTRGRQCDDQEFNDLLAIVHLIVFEELGNNLNVAMANDTSLPPLVRAINKLHVEEESRHIAFGRHLVTELAGQLIPSVTEETLKKLHDYVYQHIQSRHYEYHNATIYASIGISDAFGLRERLVQERDARFFFRMKKNPEDGVNKLLNFLYSIDLIGDEHL